MYKKLKFLKHMDISFFIFFFLNTHHTNVQKLQIYLDEVYSIYIKNLSVVFIMCVMILSLSQYPTEIQCKGPLYFGRDWDMDMDIWFYYWYSKQKNIYYICFWVQMLVNSFFILFNKNNNIIFVFLQCWCEGILDISLSSVRGP